MTIKILFCGDVVGKSGRDSIVKHITPLRQKFGLDCVVVNGENAAHGFGITSAICQSFFDAGVDVITLGNHSFDNREIIPFLDKYKNVLRPNNYPQETPGKGLCILTTPKGKKILIVSLIGRVFMEASDDPFLSIQKILHTYQLNGLVHAIILDFHAEATSEKMAMGHFCDGHISMIVGTHTHIPTADEHIMPNGTAYISDVGMCGDYNSVVGMAKEIPIFKFTKKIPAPERMQPAQGEATLCGVYVEVNEKGLASVIKSVRIGGILNNTSI